MTAGEGADGDQPQIGADEIDRGDAVALGDRTGALERWGHPSARSPWGGLFECEGRMAMVKQHCPGEGTMAPILPSQGPWLRPAGG